MIWLALAAITLVPGTRLRMVDLSPLFPPAPVEVEVPADRRASLEVTVTSEPGHGQPLRGAHVKAYFTTDEGAALVGTATTDEAGRARVPYLPRGAFWVVVDAIAHARASTHVGIDQDTETRRIAVVLGPEHSLDVRVRDEGSRPVAGAEVEVTGGGLLPVASVTDADGNVRVPRLGAGPYAVTARAPGLEEVTKTGVAEGRPFDVVLRKLGALRVAVVDGEGKAASGARVEIAGASLGAPRAATASANGDVRIAGLAAGGYALRATRGTQASAIELDVRITAGEEREVTLRLEVGAIVAVRVMAEASRAGGDEPIAGASVTLAESGITPFPATGVSDREGRIRLGPIARGPATLSVSARGYVSRGGIATIAGEGGEVTITLSRAAVIEGRVVDARGFPIGGAMLTVIGTDRSGAPIDEDPRRMRFRDALFTSTLSGPAPLIPRGELGVVPGPVPPIPRGVPTWLPSASAAPEVPLEEPWTTREDGTFRLRPVSPGRVRVFARHPQYVEAGSDVVSLDPEGRAEITLVLREGSLLEGTVTDSKGRAEAGVRVSALATRGMVDRSVRTGDDGRFAFASLPESVTLLVEADDGRSTRVPIELKDGARREVRIILPEPREPVAVRVRDDRDFPIDGVELGVGSLDPAVPLRSTVFTDSRGEARIVGARGLPLRISAQHPRHATKVTSLDSAGAELSIVLVRGESIRGEVRGRRVGAIAAAELVVTGEGTRARSSTNPRGEFRIDGLPPDRLKLVVRAKGHAPLERTITVESRQGDRGFDVGRLELDEESVVEGEVVDESGKPVAGARVGSGRVPTWIPSGTLPAGLAVANARGEFRLGELAEGTVTLEAYAADLGRGRVENVRVSPGRPTSGVRIVIAASTKVAEPNASGNVALTLGVTDDGALVVSDVVAGSTAERAGIAEGDRIVEVDGTPVKTMDEARAKLAGPVRDDVVVAVTRDGRAMTLRIPREASRR